jgi:hypothetical protein
MPNPAFWGPFALIGEGTAADIFDCAAQQFSVKSGRRRMVAQPRRQNNQKRRSKRIDAD